MKPRIMTRALVVASLAACLAAVASCAIRIDRVFLPDPGYQDAKIILEGMKSVPLRPGDAPVDIQPE